MMIGKKLACLLLLCLPLYFPCTYAFAPNSFTQISPCRCSTQSQSTRINTTTKPSSSSSSSSYHIETLSQDPKCILVHNFLSQSECQSYIDKANSFDPSLMRQSSAPAVSIQLSRLWPLPFLCMGASLPPLLRLLQETTPHDPPSLQLVAQTALPPIGIACGVALALIGAVSQGMQLYASSTRTSQSAALNQEDDCTFIADLVHRASDLTSHSWDKWEAPVITKYETDAIFASHNDASPTRGSEWEDLGGQRVVTVIAYLTTCPNGGGTKFDALGWTVQPQQGSALIFYPADKNTLEADERTVHQSLPAVEEKYIVQLFGRTRRVPPPLGIPDCFAKL